MIEIHGAVQGVGFRPFVYRLATDMGLAGWIRNDANGVFIEVDADGDTIDRFIDRLRTELPAVASIDRLDLAWGPAAGFTGFAIHHSDGSGAPTAVILPDLATCGDCLHEVLDPGDRRFGYPFTNCTNCGPRFSIIRELPYDRPNTTMSSFTMCPECTAEYADPLDRRFHAQPNACPTCGPRVSFAQGVAGPGQAGAAAIEAASEMIRGGGIVAVKGLGGYQLLTDATSDDAVGRLRMRKHRPTKPFAVLVADLDRAREIVRVDDAAADLLSGVHAPIVVLDRERDARLSSAVAPGNPTVGVMLPTTPIHHLVARLVGVPMIATSGNRSDEPICTDDAEARERLGSIADGFLSNDRPIERHVDDSVVRIVGGVPQILRRARGYAPMPVVHDEAIPPLVATGAHLKNTIAVASGGNVFVSQHIGDLETEEASAAFTRVVEDLARMYDVTPAVVAHDLHPDYVSTRYALGSGAPPGTPRVAVQHHHAHLASCLADNDHPGPALGVTWDGTGYGTDGTVWGGEFLLGDAAGFERVAHLRPFRIPGGDAAVREPRRSAAGILHELGKVLRPGDPGLGSFGGDELGILATMMDRGINAPVTTSAGRLFDAVAAMLGLGSTSSFEGEAAIALEHAANGIDAGYELTVEGGPPYVLDWGPMIDGILRDLGGGTGPGTIAGRFHGALVGGIVEVARRVGHPIVALTGGCFQNRLLTESAVRELRDSGFDVLVHRRVPPNDGGISLGQAVVAAATLTAGGGRPGTAAIDSGPRGG